MLIIEIDSSYLSHQMSLVSKWSYIRIKSPEIIVLMLKTTLYNPFQLFLVIFLAKIENFHFTNKKMSNIMTFDLN